MSHVSLAFRTRDSEMIPSIWGYNLLIHGLWQGFLFSDLGGILTTNSRGIARGAGMTSSKLLGRNKGSSLLSLTTLRFMTLPNERTPPADRYQTRRSASRVGFVWVAKDMKSWCLAYQCVSWWFGIFSLQVNPLRMCWYFLAGRPGSSNCATFLPRNGWLKTDEMKKLCTVGRSRYRYIQVSKLCLRATRTTLSGSNGPLRALQRNSHHSSWTRTAVFIPPPRKWRIEGGVPLGIPF